jgi:putative transposase
VFPLTRSPRTGFPAPRRYRRIQSELAGLGVGIAASTVRSPRANAFIERWIGTVRRECLDRILIVSRRHLEQVLPVYLRHYNEHRPHRSLDQRPPIEEPSPGSEAVVVLDRVRRRDVLGGLIHEHKAAA